MNLATSSPQLYTDEHRLSHRDLTEKLIRIFLANFGPKAEFKRYRFDNEKKIRINPRESVQKKLERNVP